MTQIKSTVFYDCSKLKSVFENTGFEFEKSGLAPGLTSFINYFLPLRAKFLSESYVAYEKDKVQGFITLEKDEKNRKRLKITKVFLEKNSLDIGKLLVQYVVSRYCAMGAVSYKVVVENSRTDLLSLFVDGCNFRKSAQEFIYKINSAVISWDENLVPEGFGFYKNIKSAEVCRLYNSNINSYQRHSFLRGKEQFEPDFACGIKDKTSFSYVLEDEQKGKVYGYFNISTYNNRDYLLDFVLDTGFEIYFEDALRFVFYCLNKRTSNWTLYVKVKTYFMNYKFFKEYCEEKNFELVKSSSVLTKDYLKEIKESSLINSAKIVFNDITPAFKTNNTFSASNYRVQNQCNHQVP